MERIRRQNAADLQELEKVFKMVESRRKDHTLAKGLKEEKALGRQVRTLTQLQALLPERVFNKMMKTVFGGV